MIEFDWEDWNFDIGDNGQIYSKSEPGYYRLRYKRRNETSKPKRNSNLFALFSLTKLHLELRRLSRLLQIALNFQHLLKTNFILVSASYQVLS